MCWSLDTLPLDSYVGFSRANRFPAMEFLQPTGGESWPLGSEERPRLYAHIIILLPCGLQVCRGRPECGSGAVLVTGKQSMEADMDWI